VIYELHVGLHAGRNVPAIARLDDRLGITA
jgi:hypothetical protein